MSTSPFGMPYSAAQLAAMKLFGNGGQNPLYPSGSSSRSPIGADYNSPSAAQNALFGNPSPQAQQYPTVSAPPSSSGEPPRGSIAESMQNQPQSSSTAVPSVNPASLQNPYQVPKRGTIAKIFLGIGEALGNPLATRIGERDRQLQEEHNEFEATGRQKTAAELNREAAQTAEAGANIQRTQYEMGKEQQTAKANAISQIQQEVESGKYGTGDALLGRWRRIAAANPHIGLTDEDIQGAITSTHPIGPKYTVMKGENGRPEGLQDRQGNVYTPDKLPQDPEAQSIWQNAQSGHQQARSEKRTDEAFVAEKAAERQAAGFVQAEKMKALEQIQPRINTALDANERLSRMESSYQSAIKGDQQAQLALLADHIGMTFGLQKNVRANKALIQEAQESQPWLQKIEAKFDKDGYLSGVALGPEQMRQMLDLGYKARDRAFASAHEAATTYGQPLPEGFNIVEGQRQPGAEPMLGGDVKHVPGGQAQGLKEGATGTGSDGKKYVVKGGVWVAQ